MLMSEQTDCPRLHSFLMTATMLFPNRWTAQILRRGSDGHEIPWRVQYSTDDEAGAGDAGEDAERDGRAARRCLIWRRSRFSADEGQSRNNCAEDRSGSGKRWRC